LSAQFRDEKRHSCGFINFSSCLRSASDFLFGIIHFSSLSAEVRAFFLLDFVKLFVHRAPHTGIKTFTIFAVTGHGNLQYITVKGNEDVLLSFTIKTIDRTSSANSLSGSVFMFFCFSWLNFKRGSADCFI
jgi:hypothetical protein